MTDSEIEFWTDFDDDLSIAKFPEDFADFLRDMGREHEADEFWHRSELYHAEHAAWEQSLEEVVELAEEYVRVNVADVDINKPRKLTYADTRQLYSDHEEMVSGASRDPLPFDREAELVRRALENDMPATPVDMDEHQHPEVVVYVPDGADITHVLCMTMLRLREYDHIASAVSFQRELNLMLRRGEPTEEELFELAWSYVDITGEQGSEAERRIHQRQRLEEAEEYEQHQREMMFQ